jgi:CRP-like cAMP-binding protein
LSTSVPTIEAPVVKSEALVHVLTSIYPIPEEVLHYIAHNATRLSIKKGKHLVKCGDVCRYIYFIEKGVLRGYIPDKKREATTWITMENEMVTSIRGFHWQEPSLENIQALDDCDLIAIHYDQLQYLYTHFTEMNILGRMILEHYYRDAEERAYISRLSSASDRYQHLLDTKPQIVTRVSLRYVASFLCMTLENLSRVRGKMGKKK